MSDTTTSLKQKLTNIAGAIRVKQGYEADDVANHPIAFNDFATAIAAIEGGGGDVDLSELFEAVGLDIPAATQTKINQLSALAGGTLPTAGSEYYDDDDIDELSAIIGGTPDNTIRELDVPYYTDITNYLDNFEASLGGQTYQIVKINEGYLPLEANYPICITAEGEDPDYDDIYAIPSPNGVNVTMYQGAYITLFGVTSSSGGSYEGAIDLPSGGTWAIYGELSQYFDGKSYSSFTINALDYTIKSISLSTGAVTTNYTVGDTLDLSHLLVEGVFQYTEDNIETEADFDIYLEDCEVSMEDGATLDTAGTITITVTYQGVTASFDITVTTA